MNSTELSESLLQVESPFGVDIGGNSPLFWPVVPASQVRKATMVPGAYVLMPYIVVYLTV